MSRAESFNPYESPQAEIAARPEEFRRFTPAPFSVGEVMSRGWAAFQSRIGLSLGILFIGGLLNVGLNLAQTIGLAMFQAVEPNQGAIAAVQLISTLALMLFNFYINVGQTLGFLKIARGEPARISDVFAGGPFLLKLILASLVLGLVSIFGMVLGAIPGGILMGTSGPRDATAITVLMLGILLAVTILSVFWVRISQFMYAGIDEPGLGAMDTIRRSMDLTRGHFWGISAVYLLLFLINLGGLLMLGVGLLFTAPLSVVMLATMYALLAGEPTVAEKPAPGYLA